MTTKTLSVEPTAFGWRDALRGGRRALAKAPFVLFLALFARIALGVLRLGPLVIWGLWSLRFLGELQRQTSLTETTPLLLRWLTHPRLWLALFILLVLGHTAAFALQALFHSGILGTLQRGTQRQKSGSISDFFRSIGAFFPEYLLLLATQWLLWGFAILWSVLGLLTALQWTKSWAFAYANQGAWAGAFVTTGILFASGFLLLFISVWNHFARISLFFDETPSILRAYAQALQTILIHRHQIAPLVVFLLGCWFGLSLLEWFAPPIVQNVIPLPFLPLILQVVIFLAAIALWVYSQASLTSCYAGLTQRATLTQLLVPPPPKRTTPNATPGSQQGRSPEPTSILLDRDPNIFLIGELFPELLLELQAQSNAPPNPTLLSNNAEQPEASKLNTPNLQSNPQNAENKPLQTMESHSSKLLDQLTSSTENPTPESSSTSKSVSTQVQLHSNQPNTSPQTQPNTPPQKEATTSELNPLPQPDSPEDKTSSE